MSSVNLRFRGAPWYDEVQRTNVTVVGAGGIGSWSAVLLARAGFNVTVYDDDTVSEHNIGGQLYGKRHIGMSKVSALYDVSLQFCDKGISGIQERYDGGLSAQLLVLGVDNIRSRREIAERHNFTALIDGRMTAESLTIFTIPRKFTFEHIREYLNTLPELESAVDEGPCSFRATSFNASIIGGLITSIAVSMFSPNRLPTKSLRLDLPVMNFVVR